MTDDLKPQGPPARRFDRFAELDVALASGTLGKVLNRADVANMLAELRRLYYIEARALEMAAAWASLPPPGSTVSPAVIEKITAAKAGFLAALPSGGKAG